MSNTDGLNSGTLALCLTVGVGMFALGAVATSYGKFSSLDDPTLMGAVLGGLIAGSVSLLATSLLLYENYADRKRRKYSKDQTICISLFLKISAVLDGSIKARRHFLNGDPRMQIRLENNTNIWKPMENFQNSEELTIDERTFFIRHCESRTFNLMNDFSGFSTIVPFFLTKYQNEFEQVFPSSLPAEAKVKIQGHVIEAERTISRTGVLLLDAVRKQLLETLEDGMPVLEELHTEVLRLLSSRYGLRIDVEVDPSSTGSRTLGDAPRQNN